MPLVSVGRHSLYMEKSGGGGPAVVFDAALGASSISWALVQPAIAKVTQTVVYDRAGLGKSEAGPMPRSASQIVDELRVLLQNAQIEPPYLLVGHSFGGMTGRLFASRYRNDMAGLVLVDPPDARNWAQMSEENRKRLYTGVWLARRGALAARLGIPHAISWMVRAGAQRTARRVSTSFSGGVLRAHADHLLAPLQKLPPDLRRAAPQAWLRPKFYEALGSQMEHLPESAAEIAAVAELGDLPLRVLTATNPSPKRFEEQEEAARLSTRGRHFVAANSGHWIPLDEPQFVIDSILEILNRSEA